MKNNKGLPIGVMFIPWWIKGKAAITLKKRLTIHKDVL